MQNNKNRKFFLIGSIICLVMSIILNVRQVSANAPETAIKKFKAYGLYNCMANRFERNFSQEYVSDPANNYIQKMIKSSYLGSSLHWNGSLGQTDDDYVALPAGHNLSNANSDKISCVHLIWDLVGSSNNENPYDNFGVLLDKFGYDKENVSSGSSAKCVDYNFSIAAGEPSTFNNKGKITYCESAVKENGSIDIAASSPKITISSGDFHIGHIDTNDASKITYCFNNFQPWFEKCSDIDDVQVAKSVSRNQSWSKVTSDLNQNIKDLIQSYYNKYYSDMGFGTVSINTGGGYWVKYDDMKVGASESETAQDMYNYKLSPFNGFKKAYKNFFGADFKSLAASYGFDKSQQAALYSNYILSYWKADSQACADTAADSKAGASDLAIGNDDDSIGQFYHPTKLYKSDGAAQYCYVKATAKQGSEVYGLADNIVGGTSNFPANSKIGFAAVAKWLLDNGPDKIDSEDISTSLSDGGSNGENTTDENTDPCYDAGIEGMSWILCPVVNNTTNTVDSFESTLKALLSIDSNSLFRDGVAYNIWENFRNIANAILVIIFLVIIFSQLTGYGIDNYGIKKMLPKLIVMGVLINLSYIICELAVDLSNILGVGLNNLFESVASAANIDTSNAGSVVAIVLVVLGAAATTAASGYLTGGGAGIIVALVLALISALVALLIFLAMIGIRMIIVVVFTVISPVAFALYILPNTQNLFKKWWKVFEAALVVYPICGVLYGAHFIVKAILSGSSNIFMNIAAIIAPFLPFFALPSLLKSAMAGLGSVAGAITAAGTAFRRGTQSVTNTAKSAVEGSERYKNAANRSAENRRFRWAEHNRNSSNLATRRKAQTLLNERTQQRAQDAVGVIPVDQALAQQRAASQRRSQEIKNYTDQYSTLTRSAMDTELQSAAAAYKADRNEQNSIRLQAAIAAADGRGMNRELLGALGQGGAGMLNLSGNDNNDQAILNQLASSGNKVLNQFAKTRSKNAATSMSLHDFVNGANAGDNLADVFNSKGAEIMNGMDDDTLSYISRSGSGAGINTETILNAAMQTSDAKELAQLNNMLRNRTGYNIKTSDFTKIKFDTYSALNPSVYANAVAELKNGSESSQRIISQMDQRVRADLGL